MNAAPPWAAAFVDVDGTLLPGLSLEVRFALAHLGRGPLALPALARFAARRLVLGARDPAAARRDKSYLRGIDHAALVRCATAWLPRAILPRLAPRMRARLAQHLADGTICFLLTGTPDFLAHPLALALGVPHVRCAALALNAGRCTGAIAGPHPFGEAKRHLLQDSCRAADLDPARCVVYANAASDLPLLESVGKPVAVRPDRRLRAVARVHHWEILEG